METQIAMIFLALGLLASLYLTLQIKMELRRSEQNWQRDIEQVRFQLNEQRSNWIQSVRKEETVLTPRVPLRAEIAFPLRASAAASASTLWGNATKAKAIEMVKRGESSTKISAALSLPKPEVEFLMKLERAAQKS
jgi:hypothetical protein